MNRDSILILRAATEHADGDPHWTQSNDLDLGGSILQASEAIGRALAFRALVGHAVFMATIDRSIAIVKQGDPLPITTAMADVALDARRA